MMNCKCVGKHVPLPIELQEIHVNGRVIALCPTTFANLQTLLQEYGLYRGQPPGNVRKHYSEYVQNIAKELQT